MRIRNKSWIINWTAVKLVLSHSLRSVLLGWGVYFAWALGFFGVLLLVNSTLTEIQTGYSTVIFEPMMVPMMGMSALMGSFMALLAGISVAREREMGTLETLFYGPIHYRDYILGKIFGYWIAYLFTMSAFLLVCICLGQITHFGFSLYLAATGVFSLFAAFALIGLGVLAASLARGVRGSLFLVLGLFILYFGLPLAAGLLTSIVSSDKFTNLIVLRDAVQVINNLLSYVSPVAYLFNGASAILQGRILVVIVYLLAAIIFGTTITFLACNSLKRRGIAR